MKQVCSLLIGLLLSGCSFLRAGNTVPEPDYQRFVDNVTIVDSGSSAVVYEYRNVRVDELAIMAALYCHDHGEKKAFLDKILLTPDHARRATFICKAPNFGEIK